MTFWKHVKETVGDFFDAPINLSRPIVMYGIVTYIMDNNVHDALMAHNHQTLAAVVAIAVFFLGMFAGWKEASYCTRWGDRRRAFQAVWGGKPEQSSISNDRSFTALVLKRCLFFAVMIIPALIAMVAIITGIIVMMINNHGDGWTMGLPIFLIGLVTLAFALLMSVMLTD